MKSLGTIVTLNNGTQKIMIITRNVVTIINEEELLFDYGSCVYPTGIDPEKMYYFNEEDIDRVIFNGFSDEDDQIYQLQMKKGLREIAGDYIKGDVQNLKK